MSDFLKNVPKGSEPDEIRNPLKDAQKAMQPELPNRFYKQVDIAEGDNGFAVQLDGRPIKTPGKLDIVVPTSALAEILAAEWDAQTDKINPANMPATRLVNTALEGVSQNRGAVIDDIVSFAGSDLLCYRADQPEELVSLQNTHWDPILEWVRGEIGNNFVLVQGVMHASQPDAALAAVRNALDKYTSPIAITCLHNFTTLTGSALLALALAKGFRDVEAIWSAAHVDEDFNISRWGEDHEASARRENRFRELRVSFSVFQSL